MRFILALTAILVQPALAVEAVDQPVAAQGDWIVQFDTRAQRQTLPVSLSIADAYTGDVTSVWGDCTVSKAGLLACPQGTLALARVGQGRYTGDLSAMTLSAEYAGGEIIDVATDEDAPTSTAVKVVKHWFWGTSCEVEQSDIDACNSWCAGRGGAGTVTAFLSNGFCHARCNCGDGDGIGTIVDRESVD